MELFGRTKFLFSIVVIVLLTTESRGQKTRSSERAKDAEEEEEKWSKGDTPFSHIKGDIEAGDTKAAEMHTNELRVENDLLSSLRVRAHNGIEATDGVSALQVVTPLIRSPRDSANRDVVLKGYIKVTGTVEYKAKERSYHESFLERSEISRSPKERIWRVGSDDDFDNGATEGWHLSKGIATSSSLVSDCGDRNFFLGGHCVSSGHEISKRITLPVPHAQIHLKAIFHFLDSWNGQYAYAKIDDEYVWMDSHMSLKQQEFMPTSFCGNPSYSDTKFGAKVDVYVPHDKSEVTITFGSTLDVDPCEGSWGVDDVSVYVR